MVFAACLCIFLCYINLDIRQQIKLMGLVEYSFIKFHFGYEHKNSVSLIKENGYIIVAISRVSGVFNLVIIDNS